MSQYDPGVVRSKPPISNNNNNNTYNNNNNNDYNDYGQELSNVETVILTVVPNERQEIGQIACIFLASDGSEKESFSFNFDTNNSFESQAVYICDRLDNLQWFTTDERDIMQIIDNSFSKTQNQKSPQPLRTIDATQYFNNYKIDENKFNSVSGATNARIRCSNIYSTLISISISNSLSTLSTNALQTQPMDDYTSNQQQQDVSPINNQSQWGNNNDTTNYNTNPNDQVLQKNDDYPINNITNDNDNNQQQEINYNNTQFTNTQTDNVVPQIEETQPIDNNNNTNNNNNGDNTNDVINNVTNDDEPQQYNEQINGGHYEQDVTQQPQEEIIQNEQQQQQDDTDIKQQAQPQYEEPPVVQSQVVDNNNNINDESQTQSQQSQLSQKENIENNVTSGPTSENNLNIEASSTPTDQSQQQEQQQQYQQQQVSSQSALSSKSSWASKFKTKTSSPKRRSLKTIDHVSENIYKGGGKGKFSSTKTVDGIRNSINTAIKQNKDSVYKANVIWVSYNGHQKPFIPRGIRPISWNTTTKKGDLSFYAIQHKSKSQNQQKFYLKNVLEVRANPWRIPNQELERLKNKYQSTNNFNNQGGYQGNYNQGGGYQTNYGQNRGNNQSRRGQNRQNNYNQGGSNNNSPQNQTGKQ